MLSCIKQQLHSWGNDEDVVNQLIFCLQNVSKKPRCCELMINDSSFVQSIEYFLNNISYFPSNTHSIIVQTVAMIGSQSSEEGSRNQYLGGLTAKIESLLLSMINSQNFSTRFENTAMREKIVVCLEMYHGLALSVQEETTNLIFEALGRHFTTFVNLLELYHSYPDVEHYILQIFKDLIKNQVISINSESRCFDKPTPVITV